MAFYLVAVPKSALSDVYGISDEIAAILAGAGDDPVGTMAREMPDQWLEDLVVAGDPEEVGREAAGAARRRRRLGERVPLPHGHGRAVDPHHRARRVPAPVIACRRPLPGVMAGLDEEAR